MTSVRVVDNILDPLSLHVSSRLSSPPQLPPKPHVWTVIHLASVLPVMRGSNDPGSHDVDQFTDVRIDRAPRATESVDGGPGATIGSRICSTLTRWGRVADIKCPMLCNENVLLPSSRPCIYFHNACRSPNGTRPVCYLNSSMLRGGPRCSRK